MKKVLIALCAMGLMTLMACKDDPVTPNPPAPELPSGDGVYMPSAKIAEIRYDGEDGQLWTWEDGLLTLIKQSELGEYVDNSWFSYQDSRLKTMSTMVQGMPVTVLFSYDGKKLTSMSASNGALQIADIAVSHNENDKIDHLSVDVNSELLGMLSQFLGGGFFKKVPSKAAVESTTVDVDLMWQGENVSQEVLKATITGSITLGEVRTMINLDSLLGSMSALLALIPDSTELPLQVAVTDSVNMTYDNYSNPMQGFLGSLENLSLSANNVLTSVSSRNAMITITFTSPYGQLPFSLPYPLPSESKTYTYTYNAAGYPETVIDNEGGETQYIYQQ